MLNLPTCRAEPAAQPPWWWLRANWLYAALRSGALPDHDGTHEKARLTLTLQPLGQLILEDGRLVVADPYLMGDDPVPILQELEPLPYTVAAATAEIGPDHPRIAATLLLHGDKAITSWEMASWPGQDPASLGPEEFFGYGVDAGTGCFASLASARAAGRVLATDAGMLEDPLSKALFAGPAAASAAVVAPEDGSLPVAVFSSGWGDGFYPTWLGRTEHGNITVAVTDFLLTGDPHAALEPPPEKQPPPPPLPAWRRLFGKRPQSPT